MSEPLDPAPVSPSETEDNYRTFITPSGRVFVSREGQVFSTAPGYGLVPIRPVEVQGKTRSGQWPKVEREHLAREPECRGCGKTTNLQVHHRKPFWKHPELELDPTNLITACVFCHFVICHAGNWEYEVVTVDNDLAEHLKVVTAAEAMLKQGG